MGNSLPSRSRPFGLEAESQDEPYFSSWKAADPDLRFNPEISTGASLSVDNTVATFAPGLTTSKAAYLNRILTRDEGSCMIYVRMRVKAGIGSQVILGLEIPHIIRSRENKYINVTSGRVLLGNSFKVLPDVALTTCEDGGEIEIHLDLHREVLEYSVTSPEDYLPVIRTYSLGKKPPYKLVPMVGVICTGFQEVTVTILGTKEILQTNPLVQVGFDVSSIFGPVEVSADGTVASRSKHLSNCCVSIDKVMERGIHSWKLKIIADIGSSICLGLAKHPLYISEDFNSSKKQIYLHKDMLLWRSYRGFLYAYGQKLNESIQPIGWTKGNPVMVEFVLNLNVGKLEIIRNEESLGVVFNGIYGPVKPVVVFYASYDKVVQIIDYKEMEEDQFVQQECITNDIGTVHSIPTSSSPLTSPVAIENQPPKIPTPLSSPPLKPATHPEPIVINNIDVEQSTFFDESSKYGQLEISENGLTISRTQDMVGNAYCLLNEVCKKGVYRWSFLIEKDQGASTCIGITSEPVDIPNSTHIYNSQSMLLCRSFQGTLYDRGRECEKQFSDFWMDGSKIELTLDIENSVLQCCINDSDGEIAFLGVRGQWRPIVAFYSKMVKRVSLIKFEELVTPVRQVSLSDGLNDLSVSPTPAHTKKDSLLDSQIPKEQSEVCVVCSIKDNNVAIQPCMHAVYCPVHADTEDKCIICDTKITGVWNIF